MSVRNRRKRRRRDHVQPGPASRPSGPSPAAAPASGAVCSAPITGAAEFCADVAEINRLIGKGEFRPAVDRAKLLHGRAGTAESEKILIDTSVARIRHLFNRGMAPEAKVLLDAAWDRFPSARDRLGRLRDVLPARHGCLDDLLRPLADPDLPSERQAAIEETVRREVTDLEALAHCPSLPAAHPLRQAALAVWDAFTAATSGPVTEERIALPEVSRRSPLAPWKMLIRAIACLYRQEDEACERAVESIDPQSAPARLAPAIRAVAAGKARGELKGSAWALVERIGGKCEELRRQLSLLDQAFESRDFRQVERAIWETVRQCKADCPEILDRLRRRVSIRGLLEGLPAARLRARLGGSPRRIADFWRLFARGMETLDDFPMACSLWEEFRRCAVHEGLFAARGAEAATLYLHMIELLRAIPKDDLAKAKPLFFSVFRGFGHYYGNEPPPDADLAAKEARGQVDAYFLDLDRVYERACAADPDPEIFREWLEWAKEHDSRWKTADEAALAWSRARPDDNRPLLHLMESAERRNALKKALGYLEQAERIDSLNPEVRRARLRLLINTAIRHLKEGKPHLAEKDFAAIESLPQAREGDRPAFLAALRWVSAALSASEVDGARWSGEVSRLLGSELAAVVVLKAAAKACALPGLRMLPLPPGPALVEVGEMAASAARACALGDDLEIPFELPEGWANRLIEDLSGGHSSLDIRQVRSLAEAALRANHPKLAYFATAAGLSRAGPDVARFLFLRARSLPAHRYVRRDNCLRAAIELARRQHDLDLAEEAVEFRRRYSRLPFSPYGDLYDSRPERQDAPADLEQIGRVVEREKSTRSFPTFSDHPQERDLIPLPPAPRAGPRSRSGPQFAAPAPFAGVGGGVYEETADDLDEESDIRIRGKFCDEDDFEDDGAEARATFDIAATLLSMLNRSVDEIYPGAPPDLRQALIEALMQPLAPDGSPPDLAELERKFPGVTARLRSFAMNAAGGGLDVPDDAFEPDPFTESFRGPRLTPRRKRPKKRPRRRR